VWIYIYIYIHIHTLHKVILISYLSFYGSIVTFNSTLKIRENIAFRMEPGSSVSIVSDYGLDDRGDRGSIPGRGR
jgi:hypothetical protein